MLKWNSSYQPYYHIDNDCYLAIIGEKLLISEGGEK